MKLEIIAICDAAANYGGKTCIMGTFDTMFVKSLPVVHRQLAVVGKIRFEPSEGSHHKAVLSFVAPDGQHLFPPAAQELSLIFGDGKRAMVGDFIFNVGNLKLTTTGEHRVELVVDGEKVGEHPVYVIQKS